MIDSNQSSVVLLALFFDLFVGQADLQRLLNFLITGIHLNLVTLRRRMDGLDEVN